MMDPSAFVLALRRFSADPGALADLRAATAQRVIDGPTLAGTAGESHLDVVESAELDAAMYLDFVLDDGPDQSVEEARDLVAATLALLAVFPSSDPWLTDLLQLARWRRATAERTRAYLAGEVTADAYRRFIERRPWSPTVRQRWLDVPDFPLGTLTAALVADEWIEVRAILAAA